jgi:DNA polymerase III alpha subunit (gram-positive type)
MVNNGNLKGAQIKVEKNGKQVQLQDVTKPRFEFALEYDCDYIFTYIKEGYVSKKVEVSTKVPKEKQSLEFEPFKFDVEIFKQYAGVNTIMYNQPVGKIKFNDVLNEFDYDTDYTKSIQNALNKIEEELKQKAKEEAENMAQSKKQEEEKLKQQKKDEEERLKQQKKDEELAKKNELEKEKERKRLEQEALNASKNAPKPSPEPAASTPQPKPKPKAPGDEDSKAIAGKKPTPKPSAGAGVVTVRPYTAATYGYPQMKSYGYVNLGDNTGIKELNTKDEYQSTKQELDP